ncbi:MAG: hypothetical protein LW875_09670 [Proteobacteria bacterium]|jgi:hypothetical protein|nr:hypothetical protein [Pseudomonadota bacterium]
MKLVTLTLAGLLIVSSVSFAKNSSLSKDCLKKVVASVEKQHTNAEGGVYALREIYSGQWASALLVGHSDQTDPTDYLVTVEKENCKIKSIVWTNESFRVENYKPSEDVNQVLK